MFVYEEQEIASKPGPVPNLGRSVPCPLGRPALRGRMSIAAAPTLRRPDRTRRLETQEAYDKFAAAQIGPYSNEVGMTEAPEMCVYEVHSYLTKK